MAKILSLLLLIVCLSTCSPGSFQDASSLQKNAQKEHKFILSHRQLFVSKFPYKTVQHDEIYPSPTATASPSPPVTILPATNPPPTIVTVPSTSPVILTPNPNTTPGVTVPITNPVTTPSTTTPVTNPVTTYPAPTSGVPATTPVTNPVVPPGTGSSAAAPGQSWCVARSGASETAIQAALDYACGIGGADCSTIQEGASCYNPNSLQNHASYAFNSYYHKNPVQTSCDFGGSGTITTTNPSSGTCVYPTSSSSQTSSPQTATTSSPTTSSPTIPSPTTSSPTIPSPIPASSGQGSLPGFNTPPSLNSSNPTSINPTSIDGTSGFGETPPAYNSSISMSIRLQPSISMFITLAISTVLARFTFGI